MLPNRKSYNCKLVRKIFYESTQIINILTHESNHVCFAMQNVAAGKPKRSLCLVSRRLTKVCENVGGSKICLQHNTCMSNFITIVTKLEDNNNPGTSVDYCNMSIVDRRPVRNKKISNFNIKQAAEDAMQYKTEDIDKRSCAFEEGLGLHNF